MRKSCRVLAAPTSGRILARVHAEDLELVFGSGATCSPTGGAGFGDDQIVDDPTDKLHDDSFNE